MSAILEKMVIVLISPARIDLSLYHTLSGFSSIHTRVVVVFTRMPSLKCRPLTNHEGVGHSPFCMLRGKTERNVWGSKTAATAEVVKTHDNKTPPRQTHSIGQPGVSYCFRIVSCSAFLLILLDIRQNKRIIFETCV